MSLLLVGEAKNEIVNQVSQAKDQLQIISAFCKIPAVRLLDDNIHNNLQSKKLMVRFQLSDLVSGTTDIDLYEYCKDNGWQLYVKFDLHAKTYMLDKKRCILGSANLTSSGISLFLHGNYELSCCADMTETDINKIDSLYESALQMNDELYKIMKSEYEYVHKNNSQNKISVSWSDEITRRIKHVSSVMFIYDFPNSKVPIYNDINSIEFLGLDRTPTIPELKEAFLRSKAFLWLYDTVDKTPEKTCFFGWVTEKLHNVLLNDPKPYRKDVKELLGNLLGWIEALEIEDIIIDVPSHSQRIRVRDSNFNVVT